MVNHPLPSRNKLPWRPTQAIELLAGTPPGGGQDRPARTLMRIMQSAGLVDVPMKITNIAGKGGGNAWDALRVRVGDPHHRLMEEEIFGPIVSVYVYPEREWEQTITLVDGTSPYALTGAVFARDRYAIEQAMRGLRHAAGNFYINDKPTGAVVGQQPFGGGRASGTNDKAGAPQNLLRWISPRTIKETFVSPTSWRYPFLG